MQDFVAFALVFDGNRFPPIGKNVAPTAALATRGDTYFPSKNPAGSKKIGSFLIIKLRSRDLNVPKSFS